MDIEIVLPAWSLRSMRVFKSTETKSHTNLIPTQGRGYPSRLEMVKLGVSRTEPQTTKKGAGKVLLESFSEKLTNLKLDEAPIRGEYNCGFTRGISLSPSVPFSQ